MNDFATVCFFETAEIIVFFIVYLINCPEIYPRIVYSWTFLFKYNFIQHFMFYL